MEGEFSVHLRLVLPSIYGGCKAKSLLDTEMLCSSFQIRFYLISSAEWNL